MINHDQYSEPIASDDEWFKVNIELYRLHKEYKEYKESLRTGGEP